MKSFRMWLWVWIVRVFIIGIVLYVLLAVFG
jgi:hypothetical protein